MKETTKNILLSGGIFVIIFLLLVIILSWIPYDSICLASPCDSKGVDSLGGPLLVENWLAILAMVLVLASGLFVLLYIWTLNTTSEKKIKEQLHE